MNPSQADIAKPNTGRRRTYQIEGVVEFGAASSSMHANAARFAALAAIFQALSLAAGLFA